jgi:hypothetical protein
MCGIWTYIKLLQNKNKIDFSKLYEDFMKLQTRGPDTSSFNIYNNNICIGFHRLAIMDLNFHANQPYILEDLGTNNVISSVSQNKALGRTIICICNGEIYNFKELDQKHNLNILNNADCMTIPKLYIKYTDFLKNESTDISKFSKLFETEIKPPLITNSFTEPSAAFTETVPSASTPRSGACPGRTPRSPSNVRAETIFASPLHTRFSGVTTSTFSICL